MTILGLDIDQLSERGRVKVVKQPDFSINVVNVSNYKRNDRTVFIYVGRAYKDWPNSALGNPYHLPRVHTPDQRIAAVENYAHWLEQRITNGAGCEWAAFESIGRAVIYPGHVAIGCWCAPKLCHAHVLQYELMRFLGAPWNEHLDQTVWAKHIAAPVSVAPLPTLQPAQLRLGWT
jgi:hypothetical protein